MIGTSIYSIVFYAVAAILSVLVILYLVKVWKPIFTAIKRTATDSAAIPAPESVVRPTVTTIVIIAAVAIVLTLGWNIKQRFTASMSNYQSPAEISEQEKVQESKMPTKEV